MNQSDHEISALPEKHRIDNKDVMRYRGRCSCGHSTYMHYSTAEAARTTVRRTHLSDINHKERTHDSSRTAHAGPGGLPGPEN